MLGFFPLLVSSYGRTGREKESRHSWSSIYNCRERGSGSPKVERCRHKTKPNKNTQAPEPKGSGENSGGGGSKMQAMQLEEAHSASETGTGIHQARRKERLVLVLY